MNTGSVEGGTGWYSIVLGQNRAVLVASMTSFQKIYGLHGLDHQIIKYSKKEKVITDRHTHRHTDTQTDRISYLRLDPFCGRGRVKNKGLKILNLAGATLRVEMYWVVNPKRPRDFLRPLRKIYPLSNRSLRHISGQSEILRSEGFYYPTHLDGVLVIIASSL